MKPNHNEIAKLAKTIRNAETQLKKLQGNGKPSGRRDRGKTRVQSPLQHTLGQIASMASRMSDDDAHTVVTKAIKAMVSNVVVIAKMRVDGRDPAAASKITSIQHLTYGQVKDAANRALVATSEQQPNLFTPEFCKSLQLVLGSVEKNRNAFSGLREMIRDDAAHGKLDANLVANYRLTTGKLASMAIRGLQAMNEKPASTGSFNSLNAQATYQAIAKKNSGANVINVFLAKHEDDLHALCIYGYGPRDGKAIFSQFCEQADRATIARIRAEAKANKMGPSVASVRKSA